MATIDLDLPLEEAPVSRFLAWIIAGLVYCAMLAFAVAALSDATLSGIARQPRIVTVALPADTDRAASEAETAQALELLRGLPGVAYTALLPREELDRLVAPWLGNAEPGQSLPLPRLIDVTFNPGVMPDLADLDRRMQQLAPGASVGETGASPVVLDQLARTLRLIGGATGALLLLATVIVTVLVTRLSLDLHDDTVDLLRLMGAPDVYVARQFEQFALASGLKGGLIGFAAGLATVLGFIYLPRLVEAPGLLPVGPRPVDWIVLAIVPVAGAILVAVAARMTAKRGLARIR